MATVTLRDSNKKMTSPKEISEFLQPFGIWYKFFDGITNLPQNASNEEILNFFAQPIQQCMEEGGYVTADVIQLQPELEGLDELLNKFNKEHWHDEDEVRFIVDGSGLFHLHPQDGPLFSIEMLPGDMISVPKGMLHWFDLCEDRSIKAIRLFQDPSGWTPHYSDSQKEKNYLPLCFGPPR